MTGRPGARAVEAFLDDARSLLGAGAVVTDPAVISGHTTDWTGRWTGSAPAVLRPRDATGLADLVAAARAHAVAIVPQGGNTGLVGGSVPHAGEVVLNLARLDALGPVDPASGQVTVGAGATLEALQEHARCAGLDFAVDLGARSAATVGGMVATNAGGVHVLRHGAMRRQVLGLDAVLGTGDAVSVNPRGLVKDNTGYDLAGLLCGSEGTLGIVTSARLRLVPRPQQIATALVGLRSVEAAVRLGATAARLGTVQAIELVLEDGLALVADHLAGTPPLAPLPTAAVLIEAAGATDPTAELADVVHAHDGDVVGAAVAVDERERLRLWRWREALPEAAAALGTVHKVDVTLPVGEIPRFVAGAADAVAQRVPGAVVTVFGHLGDGNLHVNVVDRGARSVGESERAVVAMDDVLDLVVAAGGSVSAEHGIGVAKRRWLEVQRGAAAVRAMRAVKAALDPDGILNPAVLL